MAQGRRQRRRYKRRTTGQTDYHRRLKLLRGGTPRAVVRVTNTQVICQLITYNPDGDQVVSSVDAKSLRASMHGHLRNPQSLFQQHTVPDMLLPSKCRSPVTMKRFSTLVWRHLHRATVCLLHSKAWSTVACGPSQ